MGERMRDNIVTPEVMLIGDNVLSRVRWTLDKETQRLTDLADEHSEVADLLTRNGWTPRMLAWGHMLHGFLEALDFDDERGRV